MKNEKIDNFIKLIQENPNLQVLPMVCEEVVADNMSCYWAGSFDVATVKKVYCGVTRWHFYKENDTEEQIETLEDTDWWRASLVDYYEMEDTEIKEEYDKLPWKEYIVVYIELPD